MSNFLEKANITGTSLNLKKKKEVFITYVYMKRDMFLFLIFPSKFTKPTEYQISAFVHCYYVLIKSSDLEQVYFKVSRTCTINQIKGIQE